MRSGSSYSNAWKEHDPLETGRSSVLDKGSTIIGADPYERSAERQAHANGFKEKTLQTRVGALTVAVPQVREGGFYPRSLEKGVRSERAIKLALAEM